MNRRFSVVESGSRDDNRCLSNECAFESKLHSIQVVALANRCRVSGFVSSYLLVALYVGNLSWAAPRQSNSELKSKPAFSSAQIDFFESKVRPILIEKCQSCHGSEKAESEFRVDSREAILRGGASDVPGAQPGKPHDSLLIQVVRHRGDIEMPPEQPLSEPELVILEKWVKQGMAWPNARTPVTPVTMEQRLERARQQHWAFQPVLRPEFPAPPQAPSAAANPGSALPIDQIVEGVLNSKDVSFSKPASRSELIRRAYFDLTGLPPSYEEVQAFVADTSPDAYAVLIDRLLSSTAYGERWARHWLDVARYADTVGYALDSVDRNYPFAYTYRDFVIDAFNQDMPYDEFVRLQLAADQIVKRPDDRRLAALGFLTVGRKYLQRPDVIDDQVDATTRGLLGLTVSCARCHDHKYDAIPTEDYYSLYGVFANCNVPPELPLIGNSPKTPEVQAYFTQLQNFESAIKTTHRENVAHMRRFTLRHIRDYVLLTFLPDSEKRLRKSGVIEMDPKRANRNVHRALIDFWKTKALFKKVDAEIRLQQNFEQRLEVSLKFANNLQSVADRYFAKQEPNAPLEQLFSTKHPQHELAQLLFGSGSPLTWKAKRLQSLYGQVEIKKVRTAHSQLNQHHRKTPRGVDRAMIVVDRAGAHDVKVMIRGNANRRGKVAPRQFLAVLEPGPRQKFRNGAGRLELANKIVDPKNPLTARVIANRIWMHHFGTPIVETPSDFGIRCEQPVHHKLLDYLAYRLTSQNWSLKQLHREIMLSQTYRQSSQINPESNDPENRLFARMGRRRLEWEALRDSMLKVAGQLDRQVHGRGRDQFTAPFDRRRSIYGFINRQDLPSELRVFDFASPDQSTARRIRTHVPQQGLFLMNSPFVIEMAEHLATTIEGKISETTNDQVIELAFQKTLSRSPTAEELSLFMKFLDGETPVGSNGSTEKATLSKRAQMCQILLMSNEFVLID